MLIKFDLLRALHVEPREQLGHVEGDPQKGGLDQHEVEFAQAAGQIHLPDQHLVARKALILPQREMPARSVLEGDHFVSLRAQGLDRQA